MSYKVKLGRRTISVDDFVVPTPGLGEPSWEFTLPDPNAAEDGSFCTRKDVEIQLKWQCKPQKLTGWVGKDPRGIETNVYMYLDRKGYKPSKQQGFDAIQRFRRQFGIQNPIALNNAAQRTFGKTSISKAQIEKAIESAKAYDADIHVYVHYLRVKAVISYPEADVVLIFSIPDNVHFFIDPSAKCTPEGKVKVELEEWYELSKEDPLKLPKVTDASKLIKKSELEKKKKHAEGVLEEAKKKLDEIKKEIEELGVEEGD